MAAPGLGGLWRRVRAGRLGRWCGAVASDYASALGEAWAAARARPGRWGAAAAGAAGAAACAGRCPGEASFEAGALEAAGRLALLSGRTRSAAAEAHVARVSGARARGRLRWRGLLVCALVYEAAPGEGEAALYSAVCPHLAPAAAALRPARLLDVGFWGRWWVLRARMRDCDVNPAEFAGLPARLRRVSFHHLHSARNERLFDDAKRRPDVSPPDPPDGDDPPPRRP